MKIKIIDKISQAFDSANYLYEICFNLSFQAKKIVIGPETEAESKRKRSVLMDTSVKNFQRLLNSTGEFMRDEIENLPLKKYE